MTGRLLQTVVRRAESLAAELGPEAASDSALLARFVASRDETAFGALVNRHGPMVWAVCRHLLLDPTDAEDAFQATFLALVRSARRLPSGSAVGGWLHGVAVRSAAQLRRSAARRRRREERAARPEAVQPVPDAAWDAHIAALHEEVHLLPEALRTAFVLCDLEGVRQPDAAARLGWKLGTLSGRLTKARQRLIGRLAERGIAPGLASGVLVVGAAAAGGTVPVGLAARTVGLSAAADAVPPALWKLVVEVTPMTVNRTKLIAACVLLAGGLAAGLGPVLIATADAQPPAAGEPGSLAPPAGPGGGFPGAPATPAGPGGFPGVGGPPGAGVGGPMMPSLMGGGTAPADAGRIRWEHELVDKPRSTQELASLLQRYGEKGWEFAGVVEFEAGRASTPGAGGLRPQGGGGTASVVVFKRPIRPVTLEGTTGPRFGSSMGGPTRPGGGDTSSATRSSTSGPSSGGMSPAPGLGDPTMHPGGPGQPPEAAGFLVIALKHARAPELAATLKQFLGAAQVVGDARSNSIILKTDAATAKEIVELIRKLDVPGAEDQGGTSGSGGALPQTPGSGRP
jgi:RNA polymerase sigma factor (sigma-70 family)